MQQHESTSKTNIPSHVAGKYYLNGLDQTSSSISLCHNLHKTDQDGIANSLDAGMHALRPTIPNYWDRRR